MMRCRELDKDICQSIYMDIKGNKSASFNVMAKKYSVSYRDVKLIYFAKGNYKWYMKLLERYSE